MRWPLNRLGSLVIAALLGLHLGMLLWIGVRETRALRRWYAPAKRQRPPEPRDNTEIKDPPAPGYKPLRQVKPIGDCYPV